MPRGVTDVVDVERPEHLLRGDGSRERRLGVPEEVRDELVHPDVGEEQPRFGRRDQRRRGDALVPTLLEEAQERLADRTTFHSNVSVRGVRAAQESERAKRASFPGRPVQSRLSSSSVSRIAALPSSIASENSFAMSMIPRRASRASVAGATLRAWRRANRIVTIAPAAPAPAPSAIQNARLSTAERTPSRSGLLAAETAGGRPGPRPARGGF